MADLNQPASDNTQAEKTEKLAKYLARCGVGARRKCEEYIRAGWVRVDGEIIDKVETRILPGVHKVEFRGKEVEPAATSVYIMINKPKGVLVTNKSSREAGSIIFNLITGVEERLFSIGRLDRDTTGLLILTNDGDLAQRLAHPSNEKEKEYVVEFDQPVRTGHLKKLEKGVELEDGLSKFEAVKRIHSRKLQLILTEGRKRQIRRTFKAIDLPVKELHRQRIGKLKLGTLESGKWRELDKKEVSELLK